MTGSGLAVLLLLASKAGPLADFQKRVDDYMKLHHKAELRLPSLKPTDSAENLKYHQRELARRIREERPDPKPNEIFTPEISAELRRLIASTMQGPEAHRIRQSLRHAEPVEAPLRVGDEYPANLPLQSTPPSLLQQLPKLPHELDYRVVGHSLVLRDTAANLVVDLIADAIP